MHAGECPTETTPEGTFCTLFGVEVAGPRLECADFRQCNNAVHAKKPVATAALRTRQSLARCTRISLSQHRWRLAVSKLYPNMEQTSRDRYADAFRDWSARLCTTPTTHPGVRQWAVLFSATVGDKLATSSGSGLLCPRVDEFANNPIDPRAFQLEFGFSCKKINATWRKIRAAAIDPNTGAIRVPFHAPI